MRDHKYKVGQVVSVLSVLRDVTSPAREYKILRLLSQAGAERAYHIKTITEASARFAREDEIVLHTGVSQGAAHANLDDWRKGHSIHRQEARDAPR